MAADACVGDGEERRVGKAGAGGGAAPVIEGQRVRVAEHGR